MEASSGPASSASRPGAGAFTARGSAPPPPWRLVAAALVAVSRAVLPLGALVLVTSEEQPVALRAVATAVALAGVLPAAAAWLIGRAFAAALSVAGPELVVARRELRFEIPCGSIERLRPWALPLPAPGLSLDTAGGRRLALALRDPAPLLYALAERGVAGAHAAATRGAVVYAAARSAVAPHAWRRVALRFGLFPLAPAAIFFNAHQHIAYGGSFGQWVLVGPTAWLGTLALYAATMTLYLVLYASLWRTAAEALAWLAAHATPLRAVRVREVVEWICDAAYWLGVPALVGARFLA